jgi:putative transposase
MKNKNLYTLALLGTESHFSCKTAALNLGKRWSHDTLHRALKQPIDYDLQNLLLGDLVVDDVIIDKSYSDCIEGVKTVFSPGDQRYVKGYALVVFVWHGVDNRTRVIHLDGWQAKGKMTKNELFRQAVNALAEQGLRPRRVCFDAWYASAENLNLLDALGWTYICRMKKNRYLNGEKIENHRYWGAKSQRGPLRGVSHEVQVVKHGERYLMTNARQSVNTSVLKGWYKRRWTIEVLFRDLKQFLHLERCACRTFALQIQHARHAVAGWQYLRNTYPDKSLYAAKREVLYQIRYDTHWPDAFLDRTA